VVIQVAQVRVTICAHARQRHHAHDERCHRIPGRRDQLAHADQPALHGEELSKLLVSRLGEDHLLELIDAIVEGRQGRKEAVDEAVHDVVQEDEPHRPAPAGKPPSRQPEPVTHQLERVTAVPPDGDEEVLRIEAVDLGQVVVRVPNAVADEVHEVAKILDLRSLAELGQVLRRERVELEDVRQHFHVALIRAQQIKPQQCSLTQRSADRSRLSRDGGTVRQNQLTLHRHIIPGPGVQCDIKSPALPIFTLIAALLAQAARSPLAMALARCASISVTVPTVLLKLPKPRAAAARLTAASANVIASPVSLLTSPDSLIACSDSRSRLTPSLPSLQPAM